MFHFIRFLMPVAFLLGASLILAAPPTPEKPPRFAVVKAVEKKNVTFVFWRTELAEKTSVKEVEKDGKKQAMVFKSFHLEYLPREITLNLSEMTAVTISGKTIDEVPAWKKLIGKAALINPNKEPIDPVYRAALAPGTILVQPNGPLPKSVPAPFPDGSFPAKAN